MALGLSPATLIADRFRVLQLAGTGGMGSVYQARDEENGQLVALKILHATGSSEAERFGREARLLASLDHPGIVRHIAHGQLPDGAPYLVMEWLDGCDLGQLLKQRGLTPAESLLLLRTVTAALAVAHRLGIVHRDIKPTNLFLRNGRVEQVTLLDFGVARKSDQAQGLTRTGILVGTPGYMAPEQARGQPVLTPSIDIFALGCVLFQCLTGRPPFVADYLEAILVKILFEPAPSLRSLRPELPDSLDLLLQQMLCKDPAGRIPDATALLAMLDRLDLGAESLTSLTQAAHASVLSGAEQQLVSVLVAWVDPPTDPKSVIDSTELRKRQRRLDSLRQGLDELGVRSEILADGTLVVTLTSERENAATDQAQRAARCALLLRERFPEATVALATGRGVFDGQLPIGEAIGRAVELAHSLPHPQTEDSGGGSVNPVLIDPVTAGLLDARFQTATIAGGTVALVSEQDTDESRRLLGKPTPCVGREAELGMLEAAVNACLDESAPRTMLVLAPAGVGKSRLRHEFLRRVASRGERILVLMGRGDLMGVSTPFGLLQQALLHLCEVQPNDGPAERQARLRQRLGQRLPAADRESTVAFLGELCGVPFPDANNSALRLARQQPLHMEEGIRQAFLTWLRIECQEQPVLLVLEDLHWSDPATVQLIDVALRQLHDSPLLVLALSRPEGPELFPKLWPTTAQPVFLRPLSRRASEQLVRQVLGKKTPDDVAARIVEQSAGHALFLEELIRAIAEGKGEELPKTVLAMLQGRIGRLESAARRVLRAASVFGESCWTGGVATLLGLERAETLRWMQHLVQQELLEERNESRFKNETEYRFRHALMRDAAYSLLSDEDRLLGHRLAATFLKGAGESAAVLAYHHQAAGDHEEALHSFLHAGHGAMQLSQHSEARQHYAAAIEALAHLPDSPENRRVQADILLSRVQVGLTNEPHEQLLQQLTQARTLLDSLASPDGPSEEDRHRLAHIAFFVGRVHHYSGRSEEAIDHFEQAMPVINQLGGAELLITPKSALGRALIGQGSFRRGCELLLDILEPLCELGDLGEVSSSLCYIAIALSGRGRYQEALKQLERGLDAAQRSNRSLVMDMYILRKASVHMTAADWPATLATVAPLVERQRPTTEKLVTYLSLDQLAWAESHLGLSEQALAHRAQASAVRQSIGGGIVGDWFEAAEAEMLLNANRPEDALRQAQAVVGTAQRSSQPFAHSVALRVWACALARLDADLPEVELRFAESLEVCEPHEQVVNAALTELWWGRMLHERGDAMQAASHFVRSIAMFDETGCEYAAQQARRFANI